MLWMLPLLYAAWTAFHPAVYATHFDPLAPLTFANLDGRLAGGAVRPLPAEHRACWSP